MNKYTLTLILLCSMAAFANPGGQAQQAPPVAAKPAVEVVKPPAEWLQKYAVFLTKNAEAIQLQNEVVRLRNELVAEMDGKGYTLDTAKVEWVPKPKPEAQPPAAAK